MRKIGALLKSKKVLYVLVCAFLCTLLTACSMNEQKSQVTQGGEKSTKEDMAKYNSYIELNNYMVGRLNFIMKCYFEHMGTEVEPIIEKHFSFSQQPISEYDTEKLEKAFSYVDKKPSYEGTDAAMKALYPKMKELMALIAESRPYYEQKGYIDDNFAKCKDYHRKILACYAEYKTLADKFTQEFSAVVAEQREKSLEQCKKNDQLLKYHCQSFLIRVEELQIELERQKITGKNITELDLGPYKQKYDLMVEDINKIMEYSKDAERVKREGFRADFFQESLGFARDIVEIKATAAEIIDRVQKQRKIQSHELHWLDNTEGTPEKLNAKMEAAVRDYNLKR